MAPMRHLHLCMLAVQLTLVCALSANAALLDARARTASAARTEFAGALKRKGSTALDLAALLAAEEWHATQEPEDVAKEVEAGTKALAQLVETRMSLRRRLGMTGEASAREVCTAVSSTLFGAGGLDDQQSPGLFSGNVENYYDPRNSMIDQVLERRSGIPISLSLLYTATAEAVGACLPESGTRGGWDGRLVGINAPGHLLLAPADNCRDFCIDPFVGSLLDDTLALQEFVHARMPRGAVAEDEMPRFVDALLERPMHRFDWTARSLRNLRSIYSTRLDYVRLLGAAERMLLVADANLKDESTSARPAVPSHERLECEREVAMCLYLLGDEARATEARGLLLGSLRGHTWDSGMSDDQREGWLRLLEDDFFRKS